MKAGRSWQKTLVQRIYWRQPTRSRASDCTGAEVPVQACMADTSRRHWCKESIGCNGLGAEHPIVQVLRCLCKPVRAVSFGDILPRRCAAPFDTFKFLSASRKNVLAYCPMWSASCMGKRIQPRNQVEDAEVTQARSKKCSSQRCQVAFQHKMVYATLHLPISAHYFCRLDSVLV